MTFLEIRAALKTGKGIAMAACAAALLILFVYMVWRTFIAPGKAEQKQEVTKGEVKAAVGQAQGQAGAKAANVVAGNAGKESKTHEITRDHYIEITKQPGADDPVSDPVWDAFVRSICLRDSGAGLPDCQRLRAVHPEGLEEASPERTSAPEAGGWGVGGFR